MLLYASGKITNRTFASNSMAHTCVMCGDSRKITHNCLLPYARRAPRTHFNTHAANSAGEQKSGQFLGGTIISKRGLVVVRAHGPLYIIGGWLSWGYDEGTAYNNANECMHMHAWWILGLYFVTNTSNHSR